MLKSCHRFIHFHIVYLIWNSFFFSFILAVISKHPIKINFYFSPDTFPASVFVLHRLCSRYLSTWNSCSNASALLPSLPFSSLFLPLLLLWLLPGLRTISSSSSDLPLFLITILCAVSHILLETPLGLMLMTHHPTWKHFLCGCEGTFTAANENLNNAPPSWSKRKNGKKTEICFFSSYPNIAAFVEGFIN